MRIISGIAKGRKLIQLKSKSIRPTTDRVKETIFNILARDVSGASVLDLFAGTGNLGLEALSRGAMLVDFVERSYNSIEVIKKNMKLTKLKGNIIKKNALEYIKTSAFSYDIIFADPPYNNGFVNKILYAIHFNPDILSKNGVLIIEHSSEELVLLPTDKFTIWRDKNFGDTLVTFISLDRL